MTTTSDEVSGPVQVPDRLFFRIGDVADLAGVKPYVLRYWETEFPLISPQKSSSGHRVYRRTDVETILLIKHLLYQERYSIEGARKRINELRKEGELKSVRAAVAASTPLAKPVAETAPMPAEAEVAQGDIAPVKDIRALIHELQSLARLPISELFN